MIKKNRKLGLSAEEQTARRLGFKLVPMSGASTRQKGDMVGRGFMVENKATGADSLRIRREWLCKLCREAFFDNRYPALTLQFTNGRGHPRQSGAWVLIREREFLELLDLLEKANTDEMVD